MMVITLKHVGAVLMSILMQILKFFLRQFICASVGKQINFDSIKMHGTRVKTILKYTNSGKINVEKLCTGTMTSTERFEIWGDT